MRMFAIKPFDWANTYKYLITPIMPIRVLINHKGCVLYQNMINTYERPSIPIKCLVISAESER
jgi:hypothetical protein